METYEAMRRFADSWGLLALMLFFVGVVIRVLLPGGRAAARDAAEIPFRDYADPDDPQRKDR